MNPLLNYILVNFHLNCGRMGNLDGYFITTPAKLELIKQLPRTHFHDVLGKHSEIDVKFNEPNLFTVVSEDADFIRQAANIFKVDAETGHLMGFNPFNAVWDGLWDDGDEGIPVPWMKLDAAEPDPGGE